MKKLDRSKYRSVKEAMALAGVVFEDSPAAVKPEPIKFMKSAIEYSFGVPEYG